MGSNTFKSSASENMKQIKGLDIEEKTRTVILYLILCKMLLKKLKN